MKKRCFFAVIFIILLGIEALIALFVHDSFIRPYIGDVLVVMVIYSFLRIFIPEKCRLLSLYIFIFAALVEVSQYFNLVKLLGLSNNRFMRTLLGSTFDIQDIICYAVGAAIIFSTEMIIKRARNKKPV